jgi:hypothetical protein
MCWQYCVLHSIPDDVEQWERESRGADGGVGLSGKTESELTECMDHQLRIVYESEYKDWYMRITRKFIGRPISLYIRYQVKEERNWMSWHIIIAEPCFQIHSLLSFITTSRLIITLFLSGSYNLYAPVG